MKQRPSLALEQNRELIRRVAFSHRTSNPRVFKHRQADYVERMLGAAGQVSRFVKGLTEDEFLANQKTTLCSPDPGLKQNAFS